MDSCPFQAYSHLPPSSSPRGDRPVIVTLAQTQSRTHLEPRGQKLTLDTPRRGHTHTHTHHGVGWGWGLTKPYTGQGVGGRVGTSTLHLLLTARL